MNNLHTVIIFGGEDYESTEARKVAHDAWLITATAVLADGKKVHAGNAYQATWHLLDDEVNQESQATEAIIFECSKVAAGELAIVLNADHHNPGDAGYWLGADQFWNASSLGQLMNYLGMEPSEEQLYIAASDHCPADAYQGKCPGIDPVKFKAMRISQKVEFFKKDPRNAYKASPEALESITEIAKQKLLSSQEVDWVCDLRDQWLIDELPEAALMLGMAYITQIPDTDRDRNPTGNLKIILWGHTNPETVVKFMKWANTLPNKVGDAYGNPTRGFAGVVVTP